jgi:hypothetical protein
MSIIRSIFVCCLISLLGGVALFFLGSFAGYEQFKGGYAILSVDSFLEDRYVREYLDKGRALFSGYPISESSSWVLLDVFGSFQQIPLDEYSSRVLPIDPRNDGYAEKLKNFFIRDGKRFFFVPLLAGNWKDTFLDKQFANLLQDIPFSVDYFGTGKPLSLYFIVYGAASLCLLALCFIRKILTARIVNILTLIPLFSSFSFFGAEGIAAASILFGAFFLLREPLYEIASMPGLFAGALRKKFIKEIYQPYKTYWISLILFISALAILIVFTSLKLLFLIVIFLVSLAVFFISSKILSSDEGSRRRFTPVAIMTKSKPEFAFFVYMLPFAIGALAVLIFTPFFPGANSVVDKKYEIMLNEQDYYEHITYQAEFSVRQMGSSVFAYYDYSSGSDGLPVISENQEIKKINLDDFPAFPLKHLIDFLNNVKNEL